MRPHRRSIGFNSFAVCAGLLLGCLFSPNGIKAAEDLPPVQGPVSPEESLKHLVVHPDLKVELVASEPQVIDPVAMAFDEQGRLWVVEMSDYPNGPAPGEKPKSRIRLLQDKDGDGFFETAETFADGLLFANGIQPWNNGVIVTMAGEVAYFADTDRDGRSDGQETWFKGFTEENPQLRANHPTFGLDNHMYIANGLRGGSVVAVKSEWAAKPVSISGRDFRFDIWTGKYAAVSGAGQFGLTFDAFGNRFVCSNRNPCKHIILESEYLSRNPNLAVAQVGFDVSPAGEESRVFPLVKAWTTSTLHAGQFTAACGVTIYQGDALPQEFQGNSFTCEPTGSLVHRDVLSPQGATFTSKPGREGQEFLASRDAWFRPVNLANGPDGALYVVDMYRAVIEHPQFMPAELKTRRDLTDGNDRGRIYRIVPKSGEMPKRDTQAITKLSPKEVVKLLDHPNGWHRETASRLIFSQLIFEHWDEVKELLSEIAVSGKIPEGRVRALQGLKHHAPDVLIKALDDPHPRVVEHAVRLSEPWLTDAGFQKKLKSLADHPDARLRFQVALSLGEVQDRKTIVPVLAKIALAAPEEEWTRAAVLSSIGEHSGELLSAILGQLRDSSKATRNAGLLLHEVARVLGSQKQSEMVQRVLAEISKHHAKDPRIAEPVLIGLGEGLARRRDSLDKQIQAASAETQRAISQVFQNAAENAASTEESMIRRSASLELLRFADAKTAGPVLKELATSEPNQSLRVKAIGLLSRLSDDDIAKKLFEDYRSNSPAVRRAILDCLLAKPDRVKSLLEAIADGKLAVNEFSPAQVKRLTGHADFAIKKEAQKLLAAAVPEDRKKVLEEYKIVLLLNADPNRGRAVFVKNCAACHRIGKEGVNVAPDIADSRTRQPDALLTDILDPNRAIDNNYFSFTVLTNSGETLTGIIETETETSLTLKQQEGKTVSILRSEIELLKSDGVSLMPVGLEKNIPKQDMADLISFIKNWRYLEDKVPIDLMN